MSKVVQNVEQYVRLHDGSGNSINSSAGKLSVDIGGSDVTSSSHDSFNVNANLQINDSDIAYGNSTIANSLPVTIASDQPAISIQDGGNSITVDASALDVRSLTNADVVSSEVTVVPVVGSHANASNGQLTSGADDVSSSVDCQYVSKISAFGSVDQACDITLQVSQDDINWYDTTWMHPAVGAEDFMISMPDAGARYYRLKYSASGTTATATISGKQ